MYASIIGEVELKKMVAFLKNLMYLLVLKSPEVFYVYNGHKKSRTPKVVGVRQRPQNTLRYFSQP